MTQVKGETEKKPLEPLKTESPPSGKKVYISGAISGLASRVIVHPFDTIKARMQIQRSRIDLSTIRTTRSIWSLMLELYSQEGIRGFYRGWGMTSLMGAPASGLYFYVFEKSKKVLQSSMGVSQSFTLSLLSAICAELVSCVLWVPIDVIKERMQVMSATQAYHYKNSLDAVRQIFKTDGLRGMYRGYGATVLAFGPFTGISLATYDKLKHMLGLYDKKIGVKESILLSATSGMVAGIATNPIDIVKVRLQVQRMQDAGSKTALSEKILNASAFGYKNVVDGLRKMVKEEGVLSLYKGVSARVMFGMLFSCTYLSVNDYVKFNLLSDFDNRH